LRTGGTLSELEPIEIPKVKTQKEKQKDHQPERNDQQQQFEEEEDIDDAVNLNDEEDPYEEGDIAVESCSVTVATITDEDDEEARADGVDLTDEEAGTGIINDNDGSGAGGFDNSGLNLTTLW
jgi:hypothetical protein